MRQSCGIFLALVVLKFASSRDQVFFRQTRPVCSLVNPTIAQFTHGLVFSVFNHSISIGHCVAVTFCHLKQQSLQIISSRRAQQPKHCVVVAFSNSHVWFPSGLQPSHRRGPDCLQWGRVPPTTQNRQRSSAAEGRFVPFVVSLQSFKIQKKN